MSKIDTEPQIKDVTPEIIEDCGDEINYEETIKKIIKKLENDGKRIRKLSIINMVLKSELDYKNKIINYIRNNLHNNELKKKYDEK